MGLMELAFKMIICLMIAGIIGWIIGFLLGRIFGSANATELLTQSESKMRVREQELQGARSDLTSAQAKVSSLQTEISSLAATIKTREGWINEMEAKQQELQADLDARISELDELKMESEQATVALKTQLAQAETSARTEMEALKIRVTEAESTAKLGQNTETEFASLRANFAKQTDELAQANHQLKQLAVVTQQVKEHEATITKLETVKRAGEERYAAENAQLQTRVRELETLREPSPLRAQEVEQLTAQNNALLLQHEQRNAELSALDSVGEQLKEREAEITALKIRITELEMMMREVKEPFVKISSASTMPPSPKERDDLKKVFGIGPVLEQLLNKHGVYWFRQIAEWEPADVRHYDDLLENFHGRIERERWIDSARQEHQKKYGEVL